MTTNYPTYTPEQRLIAGKSILQLLGATTLGEYLDKLDFLYKVRLRLNERQDTPESARFPTEGEALSIAVEGRVVTSSELTAIVAPIYALMPSRVDHALITDEVGNGTRSCTRIYILPTSAALRFVLTHIGNSTEWVIIGSNSARVKGDPEVLKTVIGAALGSENRDYSVTVSEPRDGYCTVSTHKTGSLKPSRS